ncbi:pentatricopeptide repeat-containing protein At1g07740, mitochondrial-like [Nicotiana sylvestris]|uniref:pentatricopeptide repeat-containing protein At1g07740, mitochondrial-like n=1 Tax=Nicotiana sylvestris TaxID=4096 RepID=UPI00388C5526
MGIWLNAVSFNIIIKMWLEKGDWELARQVFDEIIEREIEPTVVTYNCQIGFLCKKGDVEGAKSLFQDMEGKTAEAYRMLVDMQIASCNPNAATYRMVVDGFCKTGEFEEGLKVLNAMLISGHFSHVETIRCMILGLLDKGKIEDVCFVLEEMEKRKKRFDFESWEAIVKDACSNSIVVYRLVDELVF